MGHKTGIGKTCCFFCQKVISRNGLGFTSHMRKHVREGIAHEVRRSDGTLNFLNLRYYVKVGTMPGEMVLFRDPYGIAIGRKVSFRYDIADPWQTGIIDEVCDHVIFITLM